MKRRCYLAPLFFGLLLFVGYILFTKNKTGEVALKGEVPSLSQLTYPTDKEKIVISNQMQETPDLRTPAVASTPLALLSECLEVDFSSKQSLYQVAKQQGWTNPSVHKVVKRNSIFKKGNIEKRLHIVPEENSTQWRVQLFNVDAEGLPVPHERKVAANLVEAENLFNDELNGMGLESEEVLLEIDQGSLSGSLLTVGEKIAQIQLYNKKSAKVFECFSEDCVCNKLEL